MDVSSSYVDTIVRELQARDRARQQRALARDKRRRLPKRIIALPNADKKFHERWYPDRDWLDIPHPFRMVLASKPNGGKTTMIKNILMRVAQGRKPFESIVVVHCDPGATLEYEDLACRVRETIPSPDQFDPQVKTLVILEDLGYTDMGREEKHCLDRLFGYTSTHKNVSCMLTSQDPFQIMATVRRCANIFVVWNNHDMNMVKTLAARTALPKQTLVDAFHDHCPRPHDCLWVDFTNHSPAMYRRGGYERLVLNEDRKLILCEDHEHHDEHTGVSPPPRKRLKTE